MTLTILSAAFANEDGTAIALRTEERGAVLISEKDRPDLWEAYLEWGGQPAQFVKPSDDDDDLAALNVALAQEGSLFRAMAEVQYGMITGKIPLSPNLTKQAYRALLKAGMRTKG